MIDIVEAGGGEEITRIKLVTAEGIDRLVGAPLAWLIEAIEHTATDRELSMTLTALRRWRFVSAMVTALWWSYRTTTAPR